MSDQGNERPDLRTLAREEPAAVRAVANRAGGPLGDWLQRVLKEEIDG